MKPILRFTAFVLLTGVLFYLSCKKEYSCENCKGNKPPIANAGPDQLITLPTDSVSLDGSLSNDPDGSISGYLWTKISGPASFTIANAPATRPVAKNLAAGSYQFELKVTDNGGLWAKDTMRVTVDSVITTNHPPIANAEADQVITLPVDTITLNGVASFDPDNNITNYAWSKISGPSSFNISNANVVQTQVTNLVQGIYQFELKVTDAGGLFSKDTMQLTVNAAGPNNLPPVAKAGNDTTIQTQFSCASFSIPITLNGGNSYDPDGTIVSYSWTGPGIISNPNTVITQVSNLFPGTYTFLLNVTDNNGATDDDTVLVDIVSINRPLINAQLIPVGNLTQVRENIAVASAGNKILFAGGYTSGYVPSSRVDIFNITSNTWTTAELSQARSGIATAVLGNKIFFAGGGGADPSSRVDIYDVATNTWTTAELSSGRWLLAGAAAGNKVLFAGGFGTVSSAPPVDIYDGSTNTWSTDSLRNRPTGGIIGDAGIAATVIGNKIYFAGNASDWLGWDFGSITSTINIYDAVANTWSTSDLSIARGFMAGIAVGNKNYWAGGVYQQPPDAFTNLVEIRDMNSGSSSFGCLFQPNAFLSAVEKNNKIAFFTSQERWPPDNIIDKFDIYDITTNTWSVGVLPVTIEGASITSVNNTIYVAGGYVNGVLSNQVWKLEF